MHDCSRASARSSKTCVLIPTWREQIDALGVSVYEHAGGAQFVDPQTIETASGLRLRAEKFIICTGGISRRLDVPGFEFTNTHSDAWSLASVPASMLVIGGGATGAQVASVFNAFGSRVQLFHRGPRILPTEDEDISAAVASAFRQAGIAVHGRLRRDRIVREDANWRAYELPQGRRSPAARKRRWRSWQSAGRRTRPS